MNDIIQGIIKLAETPPTVLGMIVLIIVGAIAFYGMKELIGARRESESERRKLSEQLEQDKNEQDKQEDSVIRQMLEVIRESSAHNAEQMALATQQQAIANQQYAAVAKLIEQTVNGMESLSMAVMDSSAKMEHMRLTTTACGDRIDTLADEIKAQIDALKVVIVEGGAKTDAELTAMQIAIRQINDRLVDLINNVQSLRPAPVAQTE